MAEEQASTTETEENQPGFEQRLQELEAIVAKLEGDDLPLEAAIDAYERGVKLSAALNRTLEKAQRRVEILSQTDDGEIRTEPFGETDE